MQLFLSFILFNCCEALIVFLSLLFHSRNVAHFAITFEPIFILERKHTSYAYALDMQATEFALSSLHLEGALAGTPHLQMIMMECCPGRGWNALDSQGFGSCK